VIAFFYVGFIFFIAFFAHLFSFCKKQKLLSKWQHSGSFSANTSSIKNPQGLGD